MVGALVTFQFGDDFDRTRVEGVASDAAHIFEGMPGLRFKVSNLDEQARRAVNFYLWDSNDAAAGFFTPEFAETAKGFYGVLPSVELFEVAGVVDNSRSGEPVVA